MIDVAAKIIENSRVTVHESRLVRVIGEKMMASQSVATTASAAAVWERERKKRPCWREFSVRVNDVDARINR
jgi:hypothetical protein